MGTNVPDLTEYGTDTHQADTFNNESSWVDRVTNTIKVLWIG